MIEVTQSLWHRVLNLDMFTIYILGQIILFFCDAGVCTQGLMLASQMLASQALYHLTHFASPDLC
jgi:hypothetical protein